MINTEDYQAYFKQNQQLIDLLKQNHSPLYDRMVDVFLVLDYVNQLFIDKSRIDEELEVIFDVGFSYFHEQWEIINMIYHRYFHQDIISFTYYGSLINYLLYLDDLEETLKEKELLNDGRKQVIQSIYEEIEQKLINKLSFDGTLLDNYDFRLQEVIPNGIFTTMEIFGMVVEEMQL